MGGDAQRRVVGEGRFIEMERFIGCRANIQGRNIIIQRSGTNFGARTLNKGQVGRWQSVWNLSSGFDPSDGDGLSIKDARDGEKKDLQELNERLANFIEERHFYMIQIMKLEKDIEKLKANSGYDPSGIKTLYDEELREARRLLEKAVRENGQMEMKLTVYDEAMEDLRKSWELGRSNAEDDKGKSERLNQQLIDYEGEISLLRRRLASLESDREREKGLIKTLQETIKTVRQDLNSETLLHIDAESHRQSLEEELKFIHFIHAQELKDLKALSSSDSMVNNREYWKSEMGKALHDIQGLYDRKIDEMRIELEQRYQVQVQRIEASAIRHDIQDFNWNEENVRLRDQLKIYREKFDGSHDKHAQVMRELARLGRERVDFEREIREWEQKNGDLMKQVAMLKAEREATLKEIKLIRDTKHGLELEIITYRRLLDLEENRAGLLHIMNIDGSSNSISPGDEKDTEVNIFLESGTMTDSGFGTEENGEQFNRSTTSSDASRVERGQMHQTVNFVKSAKGMVIVSECPISGDYVTVENIGNEPEVTSEWKLIRTVGEGNSVTYTFNKSFALKSKEKIKVWSFGFKDSQGASNDLELNQQWGSGKHVVTTLFNQELEERAKFKQDFLK